MTRLAKEDEPRYSERYVEELEMQIDTLQNHLAKLHPWMDWAAGEGMLLHDVDAAELYMEIYPTQYAAALEQHD